LGVAGGGTGSSTTVPSTSGVANTGSGGGAGGTTNTAGSAGGSGIVIIRYPATQSPPASFGGANYPQINYADGYQIYTWTASGTVTF
jgi:hypothetical protein